MKQHRSRFPEFIVGLSMLAGALGIIGAYQTGEWHWFARSGSAIVALGVLLTGNEFLLYDRRLQERSAARGEKPKVPEDHPIRGWLGYVDAFTVWMGEMFGFWLIFIGTIIWGFGDLIEWTLR